MDDGKATTEVTTTARPPAPATDRLESARTVATVVYALQAAAFVVGLTFVVAVIIDYVKRAEVAGTWLESHFRWQIRTFWFSLLWMAVGIVTSFIFVGYFVLIGNALWLIYRIAKGWLRLAERKPMYTEE